jgi:hypothetical protein
MKLEQEAIENRAHMKETTSKLSFLNSELQIKITELALAKKINEQNLDKINDFII